MSIIFSLALVLLLFLSLHTCNARILGVVHNIPAQEFQFPISKENYQKLNPGNVFTQPDRKNALPDAPGKAKAENRVQEKNVNGENNDPGKYFQAKGNGEIKDSDSRKSWKLPHRKRGNQEPGFNLDYLPPRTHPPVHN